MNPDNDLLRIAAEHEAWLRETGDALQIAAGVIACVGIVVGCYLALHLGGLP